MIDAFAVITELVIPAGAQPGTPRIVLTSQLPPPLDTYQFAATGGPTAASAGIIFYSNSTTSYQFLVLVRSPNEIQVRWGSVIAGVVMQLDANQAAGYYLRGLGTPATKTQVIGSFDIQLIKGAGYNEVDPVDWTVNGISQSRGLVASASAVVDSAAITAETVVLTTGNFTAVNGRAYEVRCDFGITPSVANRAGCNLRKNNLAGMLVGSGGINLPAACQFHMTQKFVRTAGSDLTGIAIAQTLIPTAGNVVQNGSAIGVRTLEVWDIGIATDYPNAIAIV